MTTRKLKFLRNDLMKLARNTNDYRQRTTYVNRARLANWLLVTKRAWP